MLARLPWRLSWELDVKLWNAVVVGSTTLISTILAFPDVHA